LPVFRRTDRVAKFWKWLLCSVQQTVSWPSKVVGSMEVLWNLRGIEFAFESMEAIGIWKGLESVEIYWKCRYRGSGPYWIDGQIWPKPPAALTNCDPGFYKGPADSSLVTSREVILASV
jgi:hypothetical protein